MEKPMLLLAGPDKATGGVFSPRGLRSDETNKPLDSVGGIRPRIVQVQGSEKEDQAALIRIYREDQLKYFKKVDKLVNKLLKKVERLEKKIKNK